MADGQTRNEHRRRRPRDGMARRGGAAGGGDGPGGRGEEEEEDAAAARRRKRRRRRCRGSSFDDVQLSELRGGKRALGDVARVLQTLRPREAGLLETGGFDKVFGAVWVDAARVALGTKCGKLLVANPLLPEARACELPPGSDASPLRGQEGGGIHDLAVSWDAELVASAGVGSRPDYIGLFSRTDEGLAPVARSKEDSHSDWVFGVQWVGDRELVSASRDGSVALWRAGMDAVRRLAVDASPHAGRKVRALGLLGASKRASSGQVVTVAPSASVDRAVCLWQVGEAALEKQSYVDGAALHGYQSSTIASSTQIAPCVATSENDPHLFVLGLRSEIIAFDTRRLGTCAVEMEARDSLAGPVRSLSVWNDHYVTCGGSSGLIFFVDMRKPNERLSFTQRAPASVFTHAWNPAGTALFAGGGALAYGSKDPFGLLFS